MVRPAEPQEYLHRSSPLFTRPDVQFPGECEMSTAFPPYHPQPLRQPLVQSDRTFPSMSSSFVPYGDFQGYFPGNPTPIPENYMHSHVWEGIPPRTRIPSQVSPAGTYNMYSTREHCRIPICLRRVYPVSLDSPIAQPSVFLPIKA